MELKPIFERLITVRSADFLANDPLEFPRRFSGARDREVAAFISASLAYGRVGMIRRNLQDLFDRMPEGPAAFVRDFEPRRDLARLEGFKHRFNAARDVACLCFLLRRMIETAGSLERFFLAGDEPAVRDIGPALASFVERALSIDVRPVYGTPQIPAAAGVRYFFPNPKAGSACKRLCMFLRWVCRPDDGIDLGLWQGVDPGRLVLPLDTHTARISRLLGLTCRSSPGWKMALEITEELRRLDPGDPIRFDFVLSHLGISDGCTGKKGEICVACPVAGLCVVARGK